MVVSFQPAYTLQYDTCSRIRSSGPSPHCYGRLFVFVFYSSHTIYTLAVLYSSQNSTVYVYYSTTTNRTIIAGTQFWACNEALSAVLRCMPYIGYRSACLLPATQCRVLIHATKTAGRFRNGSAPESTSLDVFVRRTGTWGNPVKDCYGHPTCFNLASINKNKKGLNITELKCWNERSTRNWGVIQTFPDSQRPDQNTSGFLYSLIL